MFRPTALLLCCAALLLQGCKDEQTKLAEAAAAKIRETRVLGPNDLQLVSLDRTMALEVVGDSVHVFTVNSSISVPATFIENLKYADGRLRFDIKGIGMKMFEVGDGREGAVFTQADAVRFVAVIVDRQSQIEARQ
jgi:hypothetical protein